MANPTLFGELPVPPHVVPDRSARCGGSPYEDRAREAEAWAREHGVTPAIDDAVKVALVLIDVQNKFCILDQRALCRRAQRQRGGRGQPAALRRLHLTANLGNRQPDRDDA